MRPCNPPADVSLTAVKKPLKVMAIAALALITLLSLALAIFQATSGPPPITDKFPSLKNARKVAESFSTATEFFRGRKAVVRKRTTFLVVKGWYDPVCRQIGKEGGYKINYQLLGKGSHRQCTFGTRDWSAEVAEDGKDLNVKIVDSLPPTPFDQFKALIRWK
jgi:hypothetical protein